MTSPSIRWLAVLISALLVGTVASAQPSIDWFTIDSGGGTSSGMTQTGETRTVTGTVGQADAGATMTGVDAGGVVYSISGGFWPSPFTIPPCPADFNSDGSIDPDDLSDFITCFFQAAQFPGSCNAADFNADGSIDPDDLSDFITAFFMAVGIGC